MPEREAEDHQPLRPVEKVHLASAGGQLNWVARQASWHLQAGVSLCQQMAGLDDPDALKEINSLIKRGKQPLNVVIKKLQCSMDEMFTLAVSDASHAGMPGGASQAAWPSLWQNLRSLTEKLRWPL